MFYDSYNTLTKEFCKSIFVYSFIQRGFTMVRKLILPISLFCLLASPVFAFGGDDAPVAPSPKVIKDLPLPTLPAPVRPKAKHYCGSDC